MLRLQAAAHNTAEWGYGRVIEEFTAIATRLAGVVERFATAVDCLDTAFLADGVLDKLPAGSTLDATGIRSVDLDKPRMRDELRAALALAHARNGFTLAEFTVKVHALTGGDHCGYSIRQAANNHS